MGTRYSAVGNSIHSRNNFCRGIGFERLRSVSGDTAGQQPAHS